MRRALSCAAVAVAALTLPSAAGAANCGSEGAYSSAVEGTPGLLSYWRLGESSGTTACDSFGSRSGTYQGGSVLGAPGAIAGDPDTAAGFDGTDDRVTLPAMPSSVDFAVEGWQRITDSTNVNNAIYGRYGAVRLMPRPNGYYASVWLGGQEFLLQGSSGPNVGRWVHWAFVRSGATLRVYRNGVQIAGRTDLPAATPASLSGDIAIQGGSKAKASIDEVAVYGSALSETAVAGHYGAGVTPGPDPQIAAAGDIACDPNDPFFNGGLGTPTNCQQKATSDLVVGTGLAGILPLGDEQYEEGSLSDFQAVYAPTWGRANNLARPVVGNHEYLTGGATGYFDYFNGVGNATGPAGERGKGYYSFDIGAWHLVALNSNCTQVSCAAGSPQETWLRADLRDNATRCTLAFFHHPRFSSGQAGSSANMGALFTALYDANADVVVAGHDHLYERFAPQTPAAVASTQGLRQFVVGTGGKSFFPWGTIKANSEVRNNTTFGVLRLTLRPSSYEWRFVPIAGQSFTDSGSTDCH